MGADARTVWWLVACVVLTRLVAVLSAEEQPSSVEPSAAALARATAHAAANPVTLDMWVWLEKATNAVRGHKRWGHVLDAGTGPGSMSWLCGQPTESVVAVTAARDMAIGMKRKLRKPCKPVELLLDATPTADQPNVLLVGNWFTGENQRPPLTQHPVYSARRFDTVLAEYLLGALEHFAAFNERKMIDMLVSSMKDDGLLLFCGRSPFDYPGPEDYKSKYSRAKQLVLDTERIRDAAMLLSQQREYREFPAWWVAEEFKKRGLEIFRQKTFHSKVDIEYITSQLEWATREAKKVTMHSLSADLLKYIKVLQAETDATMTGASVAFGGSYCIVARKPPINSTSAQPGEPPGRSVYRHSQFLFAYVAIAVAIYSINSLRRGTWLMPVCLQRLQPCLSERC